MAKVLCEFDTKEKTFSVMMDDKKIENVYSVSFGKSWENEGEYTCCVTTSSKDEESDTRTYTQICANDTNLAKMYNSVSESKQYPGFKEIVHKISNKVSAEILKFLGK